MSNAPGDVLVTFEVSGLSQTLHVMEFQGDEEISRLYQFNLVLACSSSNIDFSKVVDHSCVLTLEGEHGSRYFHGTINSFELREKARNFTVYHASMVPAAWKLLHRHDCRIFQKKTIKQIISKILKDANIKHNWYLKGNAPPEKREYCVQYRESDWNFISRLLEEEGFYYFFSHKKGKHVLEIGNDKPFHPTIPGGSPKLSYHPPEPTMPDTEHIFSLFYREGIRSGTVTLNDFNFEKPTLDFKSSKKAKKNPDLEIYDYPGLYEVPQVGKSLADIRLQEAQSKRQTVQGGSDCIRFTSGYHFVLEDHYRKSLNQKYVLTRLTHFGEKHQDLESGSINRRIHYSNAFSCIPHSTSYRPARVTPKPQISGSQTAIVVGPSGEEIYTDKYGRVKVQFHWDRLGKSDKDSSCWIRVSQQWAGKGWGAIYIPRIGQEVVVDFLEGDPDRPLIIGRVYHIQNTVPYSLPKEKTKSTVMSNSSIGGGGSNEFRFEDKKGSEEIYIHAQKDLNGVVENDQKEVIKNNRKLHVKNDSLHTATDITLEGSNTITLKVGGSTIVMDSSSIKISSSLVQIKGKLVKIN